MKDDLLEKALKYAKHDDYNVTRKIITDLCNEIERLRELNKDVFSRIQDNKEIFNHAERYLWLRTQHGMYRRWRMHRLSSSAITRWQHGNGLMALLWT